MINRIILISKLELCNTFGINQVRYSKDKKERKKASSLLIAYLFLFLIFGFYGAAVALSFVEFGIPQAIPSIFTIICFAITIFGSILQTNSILFSLKSYEKLASLPFKPIEIIIARFVHLYLLNIGFNIVFFLPPMIIAGCNLNVGILYYVMMVIELIFLPFLALTISIILGTVLTLITSNFAHKNLIKTIITIIFSVGVIILSLIPNFSSNGSVENIDKLAESLLEVTKGINTYFLPSKLVEDAMVNNSVLSFFLLLVLNIVPFFVVAILVSWKFVPLCQRLNVSRQSKTKKIENVKSSSLFFSLLKRDLKRLTSSSLYLVNSCLGYLLVLIFSIAFPFLGIEGKLLELGVNIKAEIIIVIIFVFCVSISSTTNSSISIEGKNWWILKSLPINNKQIINSKIATNLVVAIPFVIASSIITMVLGHFTNVLAYLMIIIVPLSSLIFSSCLGLAINLKYPVLIWNNENEVCKQSKSVLFSLLFSAIVMIGLVIPLIILKIDYAYIYALIYSLLLLISSLFIYIKMCKKDLKSIE